MTYKYWLFLTKDTNELYAYTDTKEYKDQFISERNMDKFICKKKLLTMDEVHKITYNYNELFLVRKKLRTKNEEGKLYELEMTITKLEYTCIMTEGYYLLLSSIYAYAWTPPNIFNKEIQKSLEIIGYKYCFDEINGSSESLKFMSARPQFIKSVDDLGIFIRSYGDTL